MQIRLPHSVITKSPGLLPMLYSVRELADKLQIPERTLRDWIFSGAPSRRDARNHTWIHGREFSAWVDRIRVDRQKDSSGIGDNEAFCFTCNEIVKIENPTYATPTGKLLMTRGVCPNCGHTVNKGCRLPAETKGELNETA